MRRSLCLSTLLLAVSADENCLDEESSLIQEAAPIKTTKRDSKPLAGLLESARGFLTNGVTNDVVTFAEATLAEIADTIIPTLEDESRADAQWMATEWARFNAAIDTLKTANTVAHQRNEEERQASTNHKNCRAEEKIDCDEKRDCEMHLYSLWGTWVTEETELREVHAQIDGHFCVQDSNGNYIMNGTLHSFRVQSVPYMESYLEKKEDCDTAETNYDNYVPTCNTKHNDLNQKSLDCNGMQTTLETKACNHATQVYTTLQNFHSTWQALHASYQGITDLVYRQTEDRLQEYRTLTIVQCLLNRTREFNGRPCDESTGSVDVQMAHCEEAGNNTQICADRPLLCPTWQPPPPTPDNCAARITVDGTYNAAGEYVANMPLVGLNCLPTPQPFCVDPNNQDAWYINEMQEGEISPGVYNVLPPVPVPVFSETNPGCNAYPLCTACDPGTLPWTGYPTWTNYPTWEAAFGRYHTICPAASGITADTNGGCYVPGEEPASFSATHQTYDATAQAYRDHYMLDEASVGFSTDAGGATQLGAATIDGCQSDNSNSHDYEGDQTGQAIPYVWHSNFDDTAAVRCCQVDGSLPCVSQVDGTCHTAVTFSQAEAVCQAAGLRLCTQTEMSDGRCCGTGCWFNHYAVWITQDAGGTYVNPGDFQAQGTHPGTVTQLD